MDSSLDKFLPFPHASSFLTKFWYAGMIYKLSYYMYKNKSIIQKKEMKYLGKINLDYATDFAI